MKNNPKIATLVVAAGRGQRAGGDIPKQYQPVLGVSLLRRTLTALLATRLIDTVRVVIGSGDTALYVQATEGLELLDPVEGGTTRQESVFRGLQSLQNMGFDAVLIHDAARPFVSGTMLGRIIAGLGPNQGAIPALPVTDSLKKGDKNMITGEVDRAGLWRAQTPQGFPFGPILAAHEKIKGKGNELTDDAAVARAAGLVVKLVTGDEDNFKVTLPQDFTRAEKAILTQLADVRTGSGFDVHRFGPGNYITLCGIKIPHGEALQGHSDADVALHALTDAILGAIGAGDIGQHFPPSNPKWKGAASDHFLHHAAALVTARGGIIAHVDITIICEAPKIGPHRAAMVARVADILSLAPDRVSVKATTTEKLGFTGRREGIAAQAIATVRLPFEGPVL